MAEDVYTSSPLNESITGTWLSGWAHASSTRSSYPVHNTGCQDASPDHHNHRRPSTNTPLVSSAKIMQMRRGQLNHHRVAGANSSWAEWGLRMLDQGFDLHKTPEITEEAEFSSKGCILVPAIPSREAAK
ncbi:hypothetical protein DPEC_G00261800 [Dallia pectoralis]|uniref:Uncharacterized protein n=1 Tax=Dallia pectoralis TaxID=75939 RepID=A0ACC2FRV0_DALPE|nr:hypothetical protein DPEC_G00261800 [Dallia pectoralis]